MEKPEFDEYAKKYEELHNQNLGAVGETSEYFDEHKVLTLKKLLAEKAIRTEGLQFLDYGCGIGKTRSFVSQHLAGTEYHGVDASSESIAVAQSRSGFKEGFSALNSKGAIPFADGSMDVVFMACVVHHIPVERRSEVFAEIHRVLKPGGVLFIFEHNPWNPVTRYLVNTCEFDKDAVLITKNSLLKLLLGKFQRFQEKYVLFFPKTIRVKAPVLEDSMSWCGLGAQYFVAVQKR